ncbi:TRAP transporter small permease [Phaeobacter gallaeciensis]|uniref:TRAP transporter small permease protein n=1 Tax=Phaeobacter gallaeciensis TaxID=60890 RepID=A0AAC9ZBP7_9RHOB|nr:TRAP transporter small permease subunit [Phaeobacter gallaeciensis]AHD11173.1 Tripartite ATP-independent periplasmic transporter, DctQ component [Phaeobacter gallaeciensis DSM 26640]ATE94436.1 TRAP transporter, subunit DctQ [Phaeobacter gallaeciensis]ATE98709.1 TRAP transporter, subunit DctQ [Phaeobacter gallaeciensis]ATF03100.1 TRAP transporter, subunit DctQ [Phaeobacter gallaeciensis]ATF07480.1 TRAP transporter, subunit DctQ [Phaeobacter gallaeciensis]
MHKLMMGLARSMAMAGGVVLSLLILLTCLSIAGRLLNGGLHGALMQSIAPDLAEWLIAIGVGPINGDFEVVEAGVAFAIFAFLPLCQITAGHASVDIVTNSFPRGAKRFLRMVTEIVFAAVLVLIAVRLGAGALSKFQNGETSFLLEFPVWWAYAASLVAASVAAVVGIYMAAIRTIEFMTGRILVWDGVEGEQ